MLGFLVCQTNQKCISQRKEDGLYSACFTIDLAKDKQGKCELVQ